MVLRATALVILSAFVVSTTGCPRYSNHYGSLAHQAPSLDVCNSDVNNAKIEAAVTDDAKSRLRNDIVKQTEKDVIRSQESYLANIQTHRSVTYTAIDLANLGLTAAAGAVGGPAAAKAFALAATGVAGVKGVVATNFDSGENGKLELIR